MQEKQTEGRNPRNNTGVVPYGVNKKYYPHGLPYARGTDAAIRILKGLVFGG